MYSIRAELAEELEKAVAVSEEKVHERSRIRAQFSRSLLVFLGQSKWGLSNGGLRPLSAICTQLSTIMHFCGPFV